MWSKPGSKHALPETAAKIGASVKRLHDDPEYTRRTTAAWIRAGTGNRVSKLELSLKEELARLGFQHSSERITEFVGPYVPDYVNYAKREIVEVYGDYWHANPTRYSADDVLYFDQEMQVPVTASDCWRRDAKKQQYYIERGWTYRVIWEADIKAARRDNSESLVGRN